MNAIRFVIEGKGAHTVVDGKSCLMEEGDLVITPGWTWHEHVHKGTGPIVWIDALDAPLHRYLGTDKFEPGPAHDLPGLSPTRPRSRSPNIVPEAAADLPYSPVFRYPWAAGGRGGARRPASGRTARAACATSIRRHRRLGDAADGLLPDADRPHRDHPVPHHQQRRVPRGRRQRHHPRRRGHDHLGPKDIFSLPHGNWITHVAETEKATLFLVTDRDALKRLDLLKEQYGNDPR